MSNKEILEKAIKKAVDGGWEPFNELKPIGIEKWEKGGMVELAVLNTKYDKEIVWYRELEGIIFNHDFAKALWPDRGKRVIWKFYIMEMVIADDPIKYLGDNI